MAFTRKAGRSTQVRQGNNGRLIGSHRSAKAARAEVKALHAKNHPKAANRGGAAAARFRKTK